ncbi:MAG: DUF2314 domain-containing protein [Phycisphaerales bacterium]|nr:DUF2314 domain-containing protein [Phycisphaerales bacterium]
MAILPLFDVSHLPDAAWMVDPPMPSGLLAGIKATRTADDVAHAIADFIGDAIEVMPLEPPPHQEWLSQFTIPGLSTPLLFFTVNRQVEDGLGVPLEECPQLLGMEALLHPVDPLTVYINLVRLLDAAASEALFVWDIITNRVMERASLVDSFLGEGVEPPDRMLWVTEAVENKSESWIIQSRGLHRCGRAEIAVADVPQDQHQQALQLVDGLASLSLEQPLPGPRETLKIGDKLIVQLLPASEHDAASHTQSPTAIIVDPDSQKASQILVDMDGPDVAMYRTERTCARETRLARETWPTFMAVAAAVGSTVDCLVQVPFLPPEDSDADSHHLWLRVIETSGDVATGELLHVPTDAEGLNVGDHHEIDAETVSNWCVMMPQGPQGPDAAQTLQADLQQ